ncbi:MAG: polyphosphate polymerase domain-containing protein [Ruminococcaceae bacterium]|nr:polyphosphate polymerase domain-containing protein [Oscillospiraceae bacterium]
MNKRYEDKYLCTEGQLALVRVRARGCLRPDGAGENGRYTVRSLYFDGPDFPCARENEDGTSPREKYRLRLYNGDKSLIRAEIKRKDGLTSEKSSTVIDAAVARALISGQGELVSSQDPVLRKFALKILTRGYRPSVLCEYSREAYLGSPGRVRVTLDRDLRVAADRERFLEDSIGPGVPVFGLGQGLLEVKYSLLLPGWIAGSIIPENGTKTAFSKYRMCRADIFERL